MIYFNEFEARANEAEILIAKDLAGGWRGPILMTDIKEIKEKPKSKQAGLWNYIMVAEMMVEQLRAWEGEPPHATEVQLGDRWVPGSWLNEKHEFRENDDVRPEIGVIREWLAGAQSVELNRQADAVEVVNEAGYMVMWFEDNRAGMAVLRKPGDEKPVAFVGIGWESGMVTSVTMEATNDTGRRVRNWWLGKR